MADVTGLREAADTMGGFSEAIRQMADAAEAVDIDQALVDSVTVELTGAMLNSREYASTTVNRLWAAIGQALAAQLPPPPETPPETPPEPSPPPDPDLPPTDG